MSRAASGGVQPRVLGDGTLAFHLRFRAGGERESLVLHEWRNCVCGCGGGWDERGARNELGNLLAKVRAGVWERPVAVSPASAAPEGSALRGYSEFADWWIEAKLSGMIGDAPISSNTERDYRWRLGYSQAFFGETPLEEIDRRLSLGFRAHLIAQAREERSALDQGVDLRDRFGRRAVPLERASIKKVIGTFAAILDEAIEEELRGEDNPARSKRMQIKTPKPKRTFLEMDELAALLDAARDQDVALPRSATTTTAGSTAEKVGRLAAVGMKPAQIAAELGLARSTVTYHLRKLGIRVARGYVGRRVVCEVLGRAGLRASELCDLKVGRVRLHDAEGARLQVVDAKTAAGERVVLLTPDLTEVIIEHLDRLRRAGLPSGPEAYLVPNLRGGRMSRQRVAAIVREAGAAASERLAAKELPPLPTTTPHTLRRTFISIALLANEFDVKWVMDQVGHADSSMTMDVYAQLQSRIVRKHGANFDRMVSRAREQLAGVATLAG